MHIIGIRDLKGRVSEFIAKARRGERVIITHRGQEIAEIVPLGPYRKALDSLVESGRVRWKGGKPGGLKGVKPRGKPVSDTVIEGRR
jgi:prevent-host-death family protein